jgi:hypothetical protein
MTSREKLVEELSYGGVSTDSGLLYRPCPADAIVVPKQLELSDDRLLWRFPTTTDTGEILRMNPTRLRHLLADFVRLGNDNAVAEDILSFAREWGVLALCRHDLPYTHNPPSSYFPDLEWDPENRCYTVKGENRYSADIKVRMRLTAQMETENQRISGCIPCLPQTAGDDWYYDSTEQWKRLATATLAVLRITNENNQEQLASQETLEVLFPWDMWMFGDRPNTVTGQRFLVGRVVNKWIRDSRLAPTLRFYDDPPQLTLGIPRAGVGGFWGGVLTQLLAAVAGCTGLAFCSGCKLPYFPSRMPANTYSNFCPRCDEAGVPNRLAQQRRQSRHRQGITDANRPRRVLGESEVQHRKKLQRGKRNNEGSHL